MVQNPKGGGLSSSFGGGGGTQLGGVKKTTNFLDKSTWTLAGLLLALILFSNIGIMGGKSQESKVNTENIDSEGITNSSPIENTKMESDKIKSDTTANGKD